MRQRIGSALLLSPLLLSAVWMGGGCATECDEAVCALQETCGLEIEGADEGECAPMMASFARCVNQTPRDACNYLNDPVAFRGNAFDVCLNE